MAREGGNAVRVPAGADDGLTSHEEVCIEITHHLWQFNNEKKEEWLVLVGFFRSVESEIDPIFMSSPSSFLSYKCLRQSKSQVTQAIGRNHSKLLF
jgi:hypothetical protein